MVVRGWFPRQSKPICPVNWSRAKETIFGALDIENGGKLTAERRKKINSEEFVGFARSLMDTYGDFFLMLDGAPWHRSRRTSGFIEEVRDCIEPIWLPPYSPELNPVEQYWRVLKRHLSNRLFESTEEFRQVVEKEISDLYVGINKLHYLRE
ncbi:hypothetical protein AKJ45_02375 [candidate division MSBL1 archaeon SCGC-AAA261F19]|uniref:Tc1-like transposase DDE domain-containing protein n=1 Tax=candidate division MSBL1 archaeon SCGC-AAA261F19 TaxID=1698275 RepID=A0A133V9N8_9EURY|nr:hypothetical protein AKJ45_02375 [candidate division MSBL1 archaeon SCGC-AAA261F19]